MTAPSAHRPIPQPPERPLVGNIFDLSADTQVQDLMGLWKKYGEIFFLEIAGRRLVVLCSFRLVDEACDESRFDKRVWAPLKQVRRFAGDGLFTAHTFEPNWRKAHNILLPNFSMAAMKRYHPMMLDIARQMLDKWARLNPQDDIDVADEMTRLTLDTIGLCGFDYRFNSFYRERPHPFIRAMTRSLAISMDRSVRPELSNHLRIRQNRVFKRSVDLMNETVDGIIRERRGEDHSLRSDLLSAMLSGRDRETGEPLDDLNIRYQIITFLIAGHETTSGLLSFATHFLLKHPAVLAKAREEVDRVLGPDPEADPTYRQVTELRYIKQVLNESLRLWPTAPMFALYPKEGETVLGGTYEVDKRDGLAVLVPALHRDPEVWGPNAEAFDPEHFAPEAERARPANAFKPFGNGQRACIGRQFAMHEATLALGMMLQRFDLYDPHSYDLGVKETLTLKPEALRIRVTPRDLPERREAKGATPEGVATEAEVTTAAASPQPRRAAAHGTPLTVLFGSNMGTAEAVAGRIGADAERRGFAVSVEPLDHAAGGLPRQGAVILVSASYNGNPPDNAVRFCEWLADEAVADGAAQGVRYAVFGCGNRDWAATYQEVPKLLDAQMEKAGGERIAERGEGDAADDFDGDFERWSGGFWPALLEAFDLELEPLDEDDAAGLRVEVIQDRHPSPFVGAFGAQPLTVVENRELQDPTSPRSTRHLELALPTGVGYRTGDHLGVIAQNDERLVQRVLDHFGFDQQTRIRIHASAATRTEYPVDQPVAVDQLLGDYVELQDVATRSQIKILARYAECPPDKKALRSLCGDDEESQERYRSVVLDARRSVLDLLEEHAACELPFGVFLGLLSPLRPRYYSISSSPRVMDRICSITVGVVEGPARSGLGTYRGVCSNYLASKPRGSTVTAFVRDGQSGFAPPDDDSVPMIMIGPGTGIAPFRGFLQERRARRDAGADLAPAMLFFGCRREGEDYLYRDELEELERDGLVELAVAFSREQPDCKVYVQDRLTENADRVWELIGAGARIYVCGDAGSMAPGVRRAFAQLHRNETGSSEEEAEEWLADLDAEGRYLVDVWSSA